MSLRLQSTNSNIIWFNLVYDFCSELKQDILSGYLQKLPDIIWNLTGLNKSNERYEGHGSFQVFNAQIFSYILKTLYNI